jgi:hypothetical protein
MVNRPGRTATVHKDIPAHDAGDRPGGGAAEPEGPTFLQIFEEISELGAGLNVMLMPFVLIAVPGIILLLVLPAVVLLAAAAVPAVIVAAVIGPPYLLVRAIRRRGGRPHRPQPSRKMPVTAVSAAGAQMRRSAR